MSQTPIRQTLFIPLKTKSDPSSLLTNFQTIERWSGTQSFGYASLTGPGQTTTPGALTQNGPLTVLDATSGTTIHLGGPEGFYVQSNENIYEWSAVGFTLSTGTPEFAAATQIQASPAGMHLFSGSDGIQIANGTGGIVVQTAGAGHLSFYGAPPTPQAAHPTTLADVITILQNLGLCS